MEKNLIESFFHCVYCATVVKGNYGKRRKGGILSINQPTKMHNTSPHITSPTSAFAVRGRRK
jgi:hypothetical protein